MAAQYPLDVLWQQNGLGSFAAAGAMIGIAMMAIGWMVAYFLQDERLKAWVKTELLKVGFSVLIIAVALAFFSSGAVEKALYEATFVSMEPADAGWRLNHDIVCGAWDNAKPMLPPCHVRLGLDYLDTLYKTARALNRENFVVYSNFAALSNINTKSQTFMDFFTIAAINPFIALAIPSETIGILFDLVIKMMMATRFLEFLVDLSAAVLFPTFLILGLVLRMFFFSRKLGGMLVALALALYIVLPTYFALMDYVLFKMTGGWVNSGSGSLDEKIIMGLRLDAGVGQQADPTGSGTVETLPSGSARDEYFDANGQVSKKITANFCTPEDSVSKGQFMGALESTRDGVFSSITKGYVKAFKSATFFAHSWENDGLLGPGGALDNVATLMVYTVVVPFLGLMIMLASIKVFSPLIGGDVEIAGISRLL
ncbi:Uncharacterised protein [Candidatus Anstonella stagnisolia]|nr:Uncharacterised protein [Candidatus Anstonella stagnisolia]